MDPVTMLGLGAMSGGIGALGSWLGNKGNKGKSGVTAPQAVTMPQYSFTEPRMQLTSDFLSQQMQSMSEGKYPQWYEKAMPYMRQGMQRGAKEWAYGGPMTGPGAYEEARSAGAATGVGPKATMAGTSKVSDKYSQMTSAIDEFIYGKGADITAQGSYMYPQISAGMPQGPSAQIMGGQPYNVPQSPNYAGQAISQMGAAMPWLMGGQQQMPAQQTFEYGNQAVTPTQPPAGQDYSGGAFNYWNQSPQYSSQ